MRYNAPMLAISLQSGSNGNCIYVEAGGARLLFDAGISGIQAKERLALHGRDLADVDAVLISHDHVDHSRSMGILHRKFGLPIYATAETYEAASRYKLGEIADLRRFPIGRNAPLWQGLRGNDFHAPRWGQTAWCSSWTTASAAWAS